MKNIIQLIQEASGFSPVQLAQDKLYSFAQKNDFDYEKTKADIDDFFADDDAADFMDRYRLSPSQAVKFTNTLRKLYSDKKEFDKVIKKIQDSVKAVEDAANANWEICYQVYHQNISY